MGPEAQLLKEAVDQCPAWLKPRISTLASNLCFLHRVGKQPLDAKTARNMLCAMGFLLAKTIFDQAHADAAALEAKAARDLLEANPELREQVRAICPHSTFVKGDGGKGEMECQACGMRWSEVNGGSTCAPAPAAGSVADPELTAISAGMYPHEQEKAENAATVRSLEDLRNSRSGGGA